MFNENEMTYGYNDVSIQPAKISEIEHRSECVTKKNDYLPIFTAPMSTIINEKNYDIFDSNGIITILPRNIDIATRNKYMEEGKWVAYSLSEFEEIIDKYESFNVPAHIVIDVANGNMKKIFTLSKKAKEKYGKNNIILMAGNIANPETYIEYCKAGIDYARCGIGGGSGCITTSNTAIHYGIVNLLFEVYRIKKHIDVFCVSHLDGRLGSDEYQCVTKVIADGGIRNYSDVIKALALGADYVMIGGEFAKLIESCADTYYYNGLYNTEKIDPLDKYTKIKEKGGKFEIFIHPDIIMSEKLSKVFYGMASKRGQEDLFGKKKGTSEGIERKVACTTNVDKWVENMNDYLASAMSYCDIKEISDFNPDNVEVFLMSNNLQNSINK